MERWKAKSSKAWDFSVTECHTQSTLTQQTTACPSAPYWMLCHVRAQHSTAHTIHTTPQHAVTYFIPCHATWHVIFLTELSLSHPPLSFLMCLPKCITLHNIVLDSRDLCSIPNAGTKSKIFSRGCMSQALVCICQMKDIFFFFFFWSRHSMGWWQPCKGRLMLCGHRFPFIKHILMRHPNSSFILILWIIPEWGKFPFYGLLQSVLNDRCRS